MKNVPGWWSVLLAPSSADPARASGHAGELSQCREVLCAHIHSDLDVVENDRD
jgi:hypothetical protein